MGDEKYFTIQVKGTAYRFRPMPPEDVERVVLVQSLSVDSTKTIKVLTRVLKNSAGDDAWDELTDRYINGEITVQELTIDVFRKLAKRQGDAEKKAKAKSEAPVNELASADDAE